MPKRPSGTLEARAVEAMLEIATAIGEKLDPEHIAQIAVDNARTLLGADAANLWLWDAEQGALVALARNAPRSGVEPVSGQGGPRGRSPESIVSHVFRTREPLIINDYPHWPFARPEVVARGITAAMGVPLLVNGRPLGSLVVFTYGPERFEQRHAQLLMLFGSQVGPALEAARLYKVSESERLIGEAAREEVNALNAQLEQRVHERTVELQAAVRELESFSYSVSHDLRAPLRSIDGFCQVLLESYGEGMDDEGRHYLHRVRAASQRMAQLIDDLLTLAKVTRSELVREKLNLSALATTIADELESREPNREVTFRVSHGLIAYGDPRLLRVVLENLLGNAWKFTSKHATARIEFGAQEVDGTTSFFVSDDGAGFDMAYVGKLFGPFQRLHGMSEFDGTGIGLATVQRIVVRHGGTVWAQGEVERGARFSFTL